MQRLSDRPRPPYDAVLLTGGTGRRLGGVDKAGLRLDGETLLDRALAATAAAGYRVVVGPAAPTRYPVDFVREDPPGSGPGAGLLAGLDALRARTEVSDRTSGWVVVLAVDMPYVTRETVDRLLTAADREAADGADGAALTDADGRRQLCAVLAADRLAAQDPGPDRRAGCAVFGLLSGLRLVDVPAREDAGHNEALDLDTPADLPPTLEW